MSDSELAKALAFFERCDDLDLLMQQLRLIRPRAAQAVSELQRRGRPMPRPAEPPPSSEAASREEALGVVRSTRDFARLQALARVIGRRAEELQARSG